MYNMLLESSRDNHRNKLHGKVAIITGGASGIGAAIAKLFIQEGAKVIVADVEDDLGSKLCNELGPDAHYVHCDLSQEIQVSSCVDLAISRYKQLDIMFNNAGVAGKTLPECTASISEVAVSDYDRIMGINATGVFLGVKHAARVMIPRMTGCILNTASIAGVIAQGSNHAYTISKHTVLGITKSAASELCRHGIRVNSLSPAAAPTKLCLELFRHVEPSLTMQQLEQMNAANSYLPGLSLTAETVARAALFLASDHDGGFISCFITRTKTPGLTEAAHETSTTANSKHERFPSRL